MAIAAGRCSTATGDVEQRVALFWRCVDALGASDYLTAEDLGQWALNLIERDPSAGITVAEFRDSTAMMQSALERASAGIPAQPPRRTDVEQRIALFWQRVDARAPGDLLTASDLGQWALNVLDRDPSRRLQVVDFRTSTAVMQAALERARASVELLVSATSDQVNGDTSSPAALVTNPGTDGISLREALVAAQRATRPPSIRISSALAGETIHLRSALAITQKGVSITGLLGSNGSPIVSIDANASPTCKEVPDCQVFLITASDVRLSSLRIVNFCYPAAIILEPENAAGGVITDVSITDMLFDGGGACRADFTKDAITTSGQEVKGFVPAFTAIRRLTVSRSTFQGFNVEGDAIKLAASSGAIVEDVTIEGNRFLDLDVAIEMLVSQVSGGRVGPVRILKNLFRNTGGIWIYSNGSDNEFASVTIENNTFENNTVGVAVGFVPPGQGSRVKDLRISDNAFTTNGAGVSVQPRASSVAIAGLKIIRNSFRGNDQGVQMRAGLGPHASGNTISHTVIAYNLISAGRYASVRLVAGEDASGNAIDDVLIANNTVVGSRGGPAVRIFADQGTAQGNRATGISVMNNILWDNRGDFDGVDPSAVTYTLTTQSEMSRGLGNISADPRFVDAAAGDYRLKADSPAIDAAAVTPYPLGGTDLKGHPCVTVLSALAPGRCDLGAFEFVRP